MSSGMSSIPLWAKLALGGMTGFGEIGNILAAKQRSDILNTLTKDENAITSLTPQQLSAKVAAATQPLSQGLTQSVGNQVQGEMGERGLAESPGIYSAVLSQALAPYYQQNQNTAEREVMEQLMAPLRAAEGESSLLPQQTNMARLLKMLMASLQSPNSGSSPSPTGIIFPSGQDSVPNI